MPQSNTKQIKSLQFQITATIGLIIFGLLSILGSDKLFSSKNAFVLTLIIIAIIADVVSYRKLHEIKRK